MSTTESFSSFSAGQTEVFSLLKKTLTYRPLVFLGTGSLLHGDDGWAYYLLKKIKSVPAKDVHTLWTETAPENFLGPLERLHPAELIICDAADFDAPAGTIRFFPAEEIKEHPATLTHRMPFSILISMLNERCPCKTHFLLIQPSSIEFSSSLSKEVKQSLQKITRLLINELNK